MKKRQLTEDEKKQMRITKLFHENRLKEGFNWKKFVVWILILICCILTIYFFDEYWFSLIAKFGIGIIPIGLWVWIKSYKEDIQQSEKLSKIIHDVEEKKQEIEVIEYECKKAIYMPMHEDEGDCYALEIGKNKLMFWWDNEFIEEGILPNTKFEIFKNDELELIFGKRIRTLGNRFQPINIRPEIKWEFWGKIPEHGEIINSTVDKFLTEIEKEYSS